MNSPDRWSVLSSASATSGNAGCQRKFFMDLKFDGHTALITGGASGIGRATAEMFAREGCAVLLWDLAANVEQVAAEIRASHGVAVTTAQVNIVDYVAVQAALRSFLKTHDRIDHVVHCAAAGSGKFGFPFTNLAPEDWPKILEVNILGMVNVAHAITPHFVERQSGTFVFLSSVAGQIGSQTDPPYSASKAANINFAQCMAKDLAKQGIRVNTVCPGMVQTPLNRSVWKAWYDQTPVENRLDYETWAKRKIESIVPTGQWQTPEDIADMIVFLSSERSRQVTGQTINVDGGFVMHW
ncbi:MAG: SDR family oxidoreductase [Planctomycetaceae bacterium]